MSIYQSWLKQRKAINKSSLDTINVLGELADKIDDALTSYFKWHKHRIGVSYVFSLRANSKLLEKRIKKMTNMNIYGFDVIEKQIEEAERFKNNTAPYIETKLPGIFLEQIPEIGTISESKNFNVEDSFIQIALNSVNWKFNQKEQDYLVEKEKEIFGETINSDTNKYGKATPKFMQLINNFDFMKAKDFIKSYSFKVIFYSKEDIKNKKTT